MKTNLNSFISVLTAVQLILSGPLANALDIELKQNLNLRTRSGSVQVVKVGMLTKGSVISLPDSFAVKDAGGKINLDKTLDCWEEPSGSGCPAESVYKGYEAQQPGTFKYSRTKETSYFPVKLKDIKAGPGSSLPADKNGSVMLALDFVEERGNALVLTQERDVWTPVDERHSGNAEANADCASCRATGGGAGGGGAARRTSDQVAALTAITADAAPQPAPRTPRAPRTPVARRAATSGRGTGGSCAANYNNGDVLFLGDSISTAWLPYSKELARSIETGGQRVARYAVGSAAASSWRKGQFPKSGKPASCDPDGDLETGAMMAAGNVPRFSQLVSGKRPGAVVIALGTNDLNNYCATVQAAGGKTSAGMYWLNQAAELASEAKTASGECVWVLPLTYTSGQIFNHCKSVPGGMAGAIATLKAKVSPYCKVVDSSKSCPVALGFDGPIIHPIRGSDRLGSCVGNEVKRLLGR